MPRRSSSSKSSHRRTSSSKTSPLAVIGVILLLILGYLYESGRLSGVLGTPPVGNGPGVTDEAQPPTTAPGQPAADGAITPYFTTTALVYPDKQSTRGKAPLLEAFLADINAASKRIDLATFDFDIPEVTDALIAAKKRGVEVRLIVDSENLETEEVAQETGRLKSAGIPVHFDDREPFMHNKFASIDDKIAWMGSWNVTTNDTFRNNNNFIRFVNDQLAADYRNEFEQMFGGAFGTAKKSGTPYPTVQIGDATISVFYSPEDGVAKHVLESLNQAKKSIRFMAFSYTADPIADAMISKHKAGLTVDGVFEAQNAKGTGADFSKLQNGGVNILTDGNCYIMHHKTIIIDDHIVITGSYNFTASAERSNDENLVIIDSPTIASIYLDEFSRVFGQAQNPTRCGS
ncbi:phospholipase [Chloroflexia bacterium SDU3-3]|nr:phospholipase [Chloroflexia bacterium SDU3-3]